MKTANSSIGIQRALKMVCATFVIALSTCISSKLYAQAVETGHETVRGELNFSAKAAYLLDHPEPLVINFKDTAKKPRIPVSSDYIDPSMMHSRPGGVVGGTPPPMT
ncbi:MAG: hypothetical protein K9G49_15225, partial [Taibaiella sp.]|nr:hypothetical protein [Taibaiella sp.]